MTDTHITCWPILDDTRTRSCLIAEALPELAGIVAQVGAVIVGEPAWTIEPGDTPALVATTPVTVIADGPLPTRGRRPAKARDADRVRIDALLLEHPTLSAWELAELTGLSERTVRRHVNAIRKDHAA